jgi:antitoxin CptB|tara:strand:- start:284 stop:541 length:258 start_codon:yes stop_codon:yes gene_type:complete
MNELEILKNKIKYRSSYRGTKEMDILLSAFAAQITGLLSLEELKKLDDFMNCNDEDIMGFYANKISMPTFDDKKILDLFIQFKNK